MPIHIRHIPKQTWVTCIPPSSSTRRMRGNALLGQLHTQLIYFWREPHHQIWAPIRSQKIYILNANYTSNYAWHSNLNVRIKITIWEGPFQREFLHLFGMGEQRSSHSLQKSWFFLTLSKQQKCLIARESNVFLAPMLLKTTKVGKNTSFGF